MSWLRKCKRLAKVMSGGTLLFSVRLPDRPQTGATGEGPGAETVNVHGRYRCWRDTANTKRKSVALNSSGHKSTGTAVVHNRESIESRGGQRVAACLRRKVCAFQGLTLISRWKSTQLALSNSRSLPGKQQLSW